MSVRDRRQAAYDRRRALRAKAVDSLGGACCLCGYQKCLSAFDFHHPDPQGKDFTISSAMTSWARISPELEKCVLLCANCHREVHEGMHPEFGLLDIDSPWSRENISDSGEEDVEEDAL